MTGDGDPYASLLRGFDDDPTPLYPRLRERGPLWRGRLGSWVTADHGQVAELIDHPDLDVCDVAGRPDPQELPQQVLPRERTCLDVSRQELHRLADMAAPVLGAQAAEERRSLLSEAWERATGAVGDEFDLVALAEQVPVEVLGELLALPESRRARLAECCAAASIAVDALLCPQRLAETRLLLTAMEELGTLVTGPGSALRSLRTPDAQVVAGLHAIVGVRAAADVVTKTMLALLHDEEAMTDLSDDPSRAARAVEESLRHDPPAHLQALIAQRDIELAGQQVSVGSRVVLAIGAANRDPAVFTDPHRFALDRSGEEGPPVSLGPHHALVAPLVKAQAEAAVRVITGRFPRLRLSGPVLRRRRAPVTRALLRLPVSTN